MILRKSHFNLVCIVSIRKGLHKTQDQTRRIGSHTSTQNISARKFAARQIIYRKHLRSPLCGLDNACLT